MQLFAQTYEIRSGQPTNIPRTRTRTCSITSGRMSSDLFIIIKSKVHIQLLFKYLLFAFCSRFNRNRRLHRLSATNQNRNRNWNWNRIDFDFIPRMKELQHLRKNSVCVFKCVSVCRWLDSTTCVFTFSYFENQMAHPNPQNGHIFNREFKSHSFFLVYINVVVVFCCNCISN